MWRIPCVVVRVRRVSVRGRGLKDGDADEPVTEGLADILGVCAWAWG